MARRSFRKFAACRQAQIALPPPQKRLDHTTKMTSSPHFASTSQPVSAANRHPCSCHSRHAARGRRPAWPVCDFERVRHLACYLYLRAVSLRMACRPCAPYWTNVGAPGRAFAPLVTTYWLGWPRRSNRSAHVHRLHNLRRGCRRSPLASTSTIMAWVRHSSNWFRRVNRSGVL